MRLRKKKQKVFKRNFKLFKDPLQKEKQKSSKKEFEDLLGKHTKVQERYSRQSKLNKAIMKENLTLHSDNAALEANIGKVSSDYNKLKRAAQMDEGVMVGLKARMETAENELERLK